MTKIAPIVLAFCVGLSASFFTLPLWVMSAITFARAGNRSDLLGFSGSILGSVITGAIAAIAVVYAWRGISSQITQDREAVTIDLMTREEDRIEAALPGLEEALNFVDRLSQRLSREGMSSSPDFAMVLDDLNIPLEADQLRAALADQLPFTDTRTKITIERVVAVLIHRARKVQSDQHLLKIRSASGTQHDVNVQVLHISYHAMREAVAFLDDRKQEIAAKISSYRARLKVCREKIVKAMDSQ